MILAAFLIGLVLVIVATIVCVVRGIRLRKQLKRVSRTMGAELAALEAKSARTETLLSQVESRSAELDAALERLRISRARLQVLRDAIESSRSASALDPRVHTGLKMRIAAVDLGTNSTRLLVADVDGERLEEVVRRVTITRLGEGVDARRRLLPVPIARVRNCLTEYRRELEEHGAERTLCIATSAVRDAENGEAFLGEIEWSYGFRPGCSRARTRRR